MGMSGKKKVICNTQGCSISSFESYGTEIWYCYKHDGRGIVSDYQRRASLEEQIDMILDYLGMEIEETPATVRLVNKKPTRRSAR